MAVWPEKVTALRNNAAAASIKSEKEAKPLRLAPHVMETPVS
jgi:hypothetical protein